MENLQGYFCQGKGLLQIKNYSYNTFFAFISKLNFETMDVF